MNRALGACLLGAFLLGASPERPPVAPAPAVVPVHSGSAAAQPLSMSAVMPVHMEPAVRLVPSVPVVAQVHPAPAGAQVHPAPPVAQTRPAPPVAQTHPASTLTQVLPIPPPAPVPIVLPRPLPIMNSTTSALFDARLAIARAQQIDPQAAQTASFQYVQAVAQYRSGNSAAANITALAALATASRAQVRTEVPGNVPAAPLPAAAAQVPGLAGGLYGADAPAIDADSFLALARGIIDDCAARHDRRLSGARAHYALAAQAFAARNWQVTRVEAKAAIDACAQPQK